MCLETVFECCFALQRAERLFEKLHHWKRCICNPIQRASTNCFDFAIYREIGVASTWSVKASVTHTRVRKCAFLVANVTKNLVLATKISQLVTRICHLATENFCPVASWRQHKKVNFGPCIINVPVLLKTRWYFIHCFLPHFLP